MSTQTEELTFDPGTDSDEVDYLYPSDAAADGVDGFAAVTDEEIARFHEQGYLVIHNAFNGPEVAAALEGLLDLIEGKNPDFKGVNFEAKARDILHTLSRENKQDAVRKLAWFVEYDARLKALSDHPELTGLMRRIIGDEPELFQDMALLKPPLIGREKPWHQDNAYFNLPHETTVVGAWIALDEATPENGCMHVIPGSHREGPVVHFKRRDWQICDTSVATDRVVAVPLRPGGVLLFHGLIHHGTPPSHSTRRRRALQYHYKPASVGKISGEEHKAVFGADGKDVTC